MRQGIGMFKMSSKDSKRRRMGWVVLALIFVLVLGGVYYYFYWLPRHPAYAEQPYANASQRGITQFSLNDGKANLRISMHDGQWVLSDLGQMPVDQSMAQGFVQSLAAVRNTGPKIWGMIKLTEAGLNAETSGRAVRLMTWDKTGEFLDDWLYGENLGEGVYLARPLNQEIAYAVTAPVMPPLRALAWVVPAYRDYAAEQLIGAVLRNEVGEIALRRRAETDLQAWQLANLPPGMQLRAAVALPDLPRFMEQAQIVSAQRIAAIVPDQPARRRLDLIRQDGSAITLIQAPMKNQWWSFLRLTTANGQAISLPSDGWAIQFDATSNQLLALAMADLLEPAAR